MPLSEKIIESRQRGGNSASTTDLRSLKAAKSKIELPWTMKATRAILSPSFCPPLPYYDNDNRLYVISFPPLKDDDYYCDEIIYSVPPPPNLRRLKKVYIYGTRSLTVNIYTRKAFEAVTVSFLLKFPNILRGDDID